MIAILQAEKHPEVKMLFYKRLNHFREYKLFKI